MPARQRRAVHGRRVCAAVLVAGAALLGTVGPLSARGGEPEHSAELDAMIVRAAKRHGVPERLLRRIVMRESKYNPHARNHRYWGLMQISYPTARSMGFRGSPEELLNPLTNLTYAVPYLANAFVAAGKSEEAAVRLYASGYYDTARRRGLLGLLRTADSTPMANVPEPADVAQAPAGSMFGSLFGSPEPPAAQPQIAAATEAGMVPAAETVPSPRAAALPRGKPSHGGTILAADRTGRQRPPAKWMHDGGLTLLAKGEQGDGAFVATRVAAGEAAPTSRPGRNAVFASLDAPGSRPAAAQAYAASASDESAPPQAAITQALAAPGAPPAAAATDTDANRPAARSASTDQADDDAAPHQRRHRHARHHGRHRHVEEADASVASR